MNAVSRTFSSLVLVIAGVALPACSTPAEATPDAATPDAFAGSDAGPPDDATTAPDTGHDASAAPDTGPAPTCGDGAATATEACDDGNTDDGDGCSAECTNELGFTCPAGGGACSPVCGDGIRVGTEECDDGNAVDDDECTNECTFFIAGTPLRVFLSSAAYTADLDGTAGADARCQSLADAAGLGGTWRAWISDSSSSPSTRFTHSDAPYVLLNGTTVAANWASLTSGNLAHAIDVDENGDAVESTEAWTSTNVSGTYYGSGCNDFTSDDPDAPYAAVGLTGEASYQWTNVYEQFCDRVIRLYCFEQ